MALDDRLAASDGAGPSCPDAESLAAFAEGTVGAEERRRIEAHLAECADCRQVLVATMELNPVESRAAGPAAGGKVVSWPLRYRAVAVAAGLAAAVVLAVRVWVPGPASTFATPELEALADALAGEGTRPLAGRLAGGYRYAPPPPVTRGADGRGVGPDVQIAAANIEKAAIANETAATQAALGVARLVRGDIDGAIDALTEASVLDPQNADYHSDLAAAYLERARSAGGSPADWASALAAANRAIARGAGNEAHFNRALALEGALLREQAIEAWAEYGTRDGDSGWAAEAEQHRQRLVSPQSEAVPLDLQPLRERVEHVLLREWGEAYAAGDLGTAAERLDEAERVALDIVNRGGDGMPVQGIALIRGLSERGDADRVLAAAHGHEMYGRAREALDADEQQRAVDLMTSAASHFREAGSDYALWEHVFRGILLRNQGKPQASIDAFARVAAASPPASYSHLRARVEWGTGVGYDEQGRYDRGIQYLERAVDGFRRSSERTYTVSTRALLAEAEWVLGDHERAWMHVRDVSREIERGGIRPSFYHLAIAGRLALSARLPEAALEFETARVQAVSSPRTLAEAFKRRARTFTLLGNYAAAESDLNRAVASVEQLADEALRIRNAADVSISRAELLSRSDSRRAIQEADEAMRTVPERDPALRLAQLLALRARAYEREGDIAAARTDLIAAIDEFEAKRTQLASVEDQLRAFDGERPIFKQLIQLEALGAGDAIAALGVAERSRAGAGRRHGGLLDPASDHARLPAGTAVAFFEVLDDHVLAWTLTRDRISHFSRTWPREALSLDVQRIERAIADGADVRGLMAPAARIMRELVAPVLEAAGPRSTVFIVPDGPLARVPFAALPDASGEPLVANHAIGVGTSLTDLLSGVGRLSRAAPRSVVALGDGHDPSASHLPMLPLADAEARAVGALYPQRTVLTGTAATRQGLLADSGDVLHFAGHTVVNREFPLLSRLLLAPEGRGGDGALLGSEVLAHRFNRTQVVVLASCDTGLGTVIDGEGVVSVARAFLGAGVPAVIASLWPVEDDTHELMTAVHRQLAASSPPADALRAAQLTVLRTRGAGAAVRIWGGFTAFGGMAAGREAES
ncbi:MAG: CHAT domain-containing protein [Vicinamibacterales bacterium]